MNIKDQLFKAVSDGKLLELRRLLTENKGYTEVKNDIGRTLLQEAAFLGKDKFISPLVETYGLDINSLSVDGKGAKQKAPIHLAAEQGHLNTVKAICACKGVDLTLKDASDKTALHYASKGGFSEIVLHLLSNEKVKAAVNEGDKDEKTSLQMAVEADDESESSENTVKALMNAGGDPNSKDNSGRNSLHRAARKGSRKISVLLVQFQGIDINSLDESKRTPLHYAAESGHLELVKMLCNKGAIRDLKDKDGKTPLDLASDAHKDDVFEYLSGKEEDVNKVLEDVDEEDKAKGLGKRAIHKAVKSENSIQVKKLISKKADLSVQTTTGATPLHLAAKLESAEIARALLEAGADPNSEDHDKKRPLHIAASKGNKEVVIALCENKNTEVNAEDKNRHSPLHHLFVSYSELAEKDKSKPKELVELLVGTYKALITEDDLVYVKTPSTGIPKEVISYLETAYEKTVQEIATQMLNSIAESKPAPSLTPLDLDKLPKKQQARPRLATIDKSKLPKPPARPGSKTIKAKAGTLADLDRESVANDASEKESYRDLEELVQQLSSRVGSGKNSEEDEGKTIKTRHISKKRQSSGEVSAAELDDLVEQLSSRVGSRQNSDDESDQNVGKRKHSSSEEHQGTESDVDDADSANDVPKNQGDPKKKPVIPIRPQPDIYKAFFGRLDKEMKLHDQNSKKYKTLDKARKEFTDIVMQVPEGDDESAIIKQLENAVVKWKDKKVVKELDLYKVFWILLSVIPNIATLGLANLNSNWRNFWYETRAQNCLRNMVEKDLVFPVKEAEAAS